MVGEAVAVAEKVGEDRERRARLDGVLLSSLTPREREILAHIVAGRTYAEIARALVVSEKTVSVHVSNMLRKTGTVNRVELAQLTRRLTSPAHGPQLS